MIFFLGDNGSASPLGQINEIASSAPLKGKKGTSWEGGMRVPFIVAWAKANSSNIMQQQLPIAQNQINSQITTVLDIYPTILSAASANNPSTHIIDGVNLAKQLSGQINVQRKNSFLMHFPHKHKHSYFTSYRLDNWKVIYHYNPENRVGIKRYQLFNLATDISESDDLATLQPKILAKMMASMVAELVRQNAQYPIDKHGRIIKPILPNTSS